MGDNEWVMQGRNFRTRAIEGAAIPDMQTRCRHCGEWKGPLDYVSAEDFSRKRQCRDCRRKAVEAEYAAFHPAGQRGAEQ